MRATFIIRLVPGGSQESPKRHQPKKRLINIRRGESGGRGVVWAFMVARGVGGDRVAARFKPDEQARGRP